MIVSLPALVGGAVAAVALALAVRRMLPQRLDVSEVLRRTHRPAPEQLAPAVHGKRQFFDAWTEQAGSRLAASEVVARRLPSQDLRLVGVTGSQLLSRCVTYGLFGLLFPQFMALLAGVLGMHAPFAVPFAGSLLFAVFFVFKCVDEIRDDAKKLREEWRYAVVSLLERLLLTRASDAAPGEALVRAASVGDSRPAVQIREALAHARLTGTSPWKALEELGRDLGVTELAHPARALALAGEEKTAITSTLENQIDVLRAAVNTDRRAAANRATEAMDIPSLAVGFCLVVFIAAPAFVKILNI